MRRVVRAVPQADYFSHLRGVSLPDWQLMPCKRAGKLLTGCHDLACSWLTFFFPYCATWILGREDEAINIAAARKGCSPLLTGWVTPFEEVIEWL